MKSETVQLKFNTLVPQQPGKLKQELPKYIYMKF